jgi:hypothetical protein
MEANEAQELKENAEHGASMRPVAFTISVLAVLGHRTEHTEAVLSQNKATDEWNYYQAHKIRSNDTELAEDLLGVANIDAADKLAKSYADHQKKWDDELNDAQKKATDLEADVARAEALIEIGLVITSVTLLTRSRIYRYPGMVFSFAGIASVASAFVLK